MNKKLIIATLSSILMALPLAAFAVYNNPPLPITLPVTTIDGLVIAILGVLWPIFMGFAVIMFMIAGFNFFTAQGEPSKLVVVRTAVIWGVVGLVVGMLALTIPVVVKTALGV